MASRVQVLKSTPVYDGKVVRLKVDRVIEPGGVTTTREVVCHAGSVVILPHLPGGRVLMVRQFRYPARRWLWELVAGGIEPGETPFEAAQRELLEETGHQAKAFRPLFTFFSSPGFLSEQMHLVEGHGLTRTKAQPRADERIRVGRFTRLQLRRMLARRQIQDAKTLVGVLWYLGSRARKG